MFWRICRMPDHLTYLPNYHFFAFSSRRSQVLTSPGLSGSVAVRSMEAARCVQMPNEALRVSAAGFHNCGLGCCCCLMNESFSFSFSSSFFFFLSLSGRMYLASWFCLHTPRMYLDDL